MATFLYDPTPTPLGWRSWFGALYAEDTIRADFRADAVTSGFRDEFTTGWNEVHGRASTYTYPNGIISSSANHRQLGVYGEQREIPAATAPRARLEPVRHASIQP